MAFSRSNGPVILIALGSNLPGKGGATPLENCEAALEALTERDIDVVKCSRWYQSAPVPPSGQPWFINGVARIATQKGPRDVMATLLAVEQAFGRTRGEKNAARVLDLDLLAYGDTVISEPGLTLPHPRLHRRLFVLLPLRDVAPRWRHPETGRSVSDMIRALGPIEGIEPVEGTATKVNDCAPGT